MATFESFTQLTHAPRIPLAAGRLHSGPGLRERAKLAFAAGEDDRSAGGGRDGRHRSARHFQPARARAGIHAE